MKRDPRDSFLVVFFFVCLFVFCLFVCLFVCFVGLSPGSNQTPGLAHSYSPGACSGVQVDLEPTASTGTLSLRDSFFLHW